VSQNIRTLDLLLPITSLNIDRFFKILSPADSPVERSLKIPPHLKRVATLPCKTLVFKIDLISTLTPVSACSSWANEQDYRFPRRLKRFSYIRGDITVLVLIDFSGCDLFCVLCLLKQFVHHSLPPLQKCNNLRDRGHLYKLPDLWPPNSPDLNPTDYKIWGMIQQRVHNTKVQDVKALMLRLIDPWDGVEDKSRCHWPSAQASTYCIQPQTGIMNIHSDKKI